MNMICCYNKQRQLQHFQVPEEVATYIKQLEAYVKYPQLSGLKRLYDFRFK